LGPICIQNLFNNTITRELIQTLHLINLYNLDGNSMASILQHTPNIIDINLQGNISIHTLTSHTLSTLKFLTTISLQNCTTITPNNLHIILSNNKLIDINLSLTKITNEILILTNTEQLQTLSLSQCHYIHIFLISPNLQNLQFLHTLSLRCANSLKNDVMCKISMIQQLTNLDITGTEVFTSSMPHLIHNTLTLRTLRIINTSINQHSIQPLIIRNNITFYTDFI
jgi:hypothetical protein